MTDEERDLIKKYVEHQVKIAIHNAKLKESMEFLKEAGIEPWQYEQFYDSDSMEFDG